MIPNSDQPIGRVIHVPNTSQGKRRRKSEKDETTNHDVSSICHQRLNATKLEQGSGESLREHQHRILERIKKQQLKKQRNNSMGNMENDTALWSSSADKNSEEPTRNSNDNGLDSNDAILSIEQLAASLMPPKIVKGNDDDEQHPSSKYRDSRRQSCYF